MNKDEALTLALKVLEAIYYGMDARPRVQYASITAIKEALAQPEHMEAVLTMVRPESKKYRRGDRLRCLETDDVCVVHISGDKTQLVKFPDGDVLDYTNEQVTELFDLIPKESEWLPEDMAYRPGVLTNFCSRCGKRLMSALGPVNIHTCTPPQGRTFDDYGNKIV